MNPNEEQFDDFKVAEESPEMENVVANTIVAKELTEVEQYKEEVLDEILGMADSPKDELTQLVVGYIQAMGDVDQVNLCSYDNGNGVALDGWGFNGDEDLVSIDLFLTVLVDPEKSNTLPKSEIERHFKWMEKFFERSQTGTMFSRITDKRSELYQIAQLINDAEKVDRVRMFLMTNAIAPANLEIDEKETEEGTIMEYHLWDVKRIKKHDDILRGKEAVVVDFEDKGKN